MYVKFLEDTIVINETKRSIVNNGTHAITESLPEKDGERCFFDGADSYAVSNKLVEKACKGCSYKISDYSYDEKTCTLKFKLYNNFTNNKICTDQIDITDYITANPISRQSFEIMED